MSKPGLITAFKLRTHTTALAMALGVAGLTGLSVWAAVGQDLLQRPAMMAPKAARALTLNLATQGDRTLVVGERGIVLIKAAEGVQGAVKDTEGNFWKQATVPVSVNLTSLRFASDKVVYAVGHDGVVLKSSDAGDNWTLVFDGNKANEQVVGAAKAKLDALSAQVEAARAGQKGGESLEDMERKLEEMQFAFEDAEAGARFGPARPLLDVWFKDETTGWVVGSYGQIFETTDGGSNWTLIANRLDNPDSRHYNGMWGNSEGLLLLAGEAGRVYESRDFGQTWKRHDTGYNGHLYGALAVKTSTGDTSLVAYGFRGNIYRLGAGADAWVKVTSPTGESLVGAVFDGERVLMVDQASRLVALENAATSVRLLTTKEGVPTTGLTKVADGLLVSGQGGPRTMKIPQ